MHQQIEFVIQIFERVEYDRQRIEGLLVLEMQRVENIVTYASGEL